MNPTIPAYTLSNLTGAVGDVVRASTVWGMAEARGEETREHIVAVAQAVAQLLALCLQREPSQEELGAVIGG